MATDDLISTSVERRGGVTVLGVVGEIDMATAPVLDTAIAEVLAGGPIPLVIDLSAVQFLASAGLTVLVATREKVGEAARFAVVGRSPETSRLIRLAGVDKLLWLHETLEDALAAVGGRPPGGSEGSVMS